MPPESRIVQELEKKIDQLDARMGGLETAVAVMQAGVVRIERDIAAAGQERSRIASELGAYGIQLTKFVAEIGGVNQILHKLEPAVQSLQQDRAMVIGGAKAVGAATGTIGRMAWAIGGAVAGIAVAIGGYLAALISRSPPPSHP